MSVAKATIEVNPKSSRRGSRKRMKPTIINPNPHCLFQYITKAEKDSMKEKRHFHPRFSLEIKKEVAHLDNFVKQKRKIITKKNTRVGFMIVGSLELETQKYLG